MDRLRKYGPFVGLMIAGAFMRFLLWRRTGVYLYGDMLRYETMARHLAFHGYLGYGAVPDAFVTPAYPVFLAILYKLEFLIHGGHAIAETRAVHEIFFVQQGISLVTIALAYWLGLRLAGPIAAFGAGLLTLLYLPNGFVGLMLLTEAIFIPLLLATLLAFVYAQQTGKMWIYAATGALLGLTTLARPTVLPLILLFAVFAALKGTDRKQRINRAGILAAGLVVVMMPWWIRNYIDFHKLILLSTEAGNPLLAGANPYFQVNVNTLIGRSRALHESQAQYAIQYMIHGFTHHFFLFAGWYLFGKIPLLLWKPWTYQYLAWFVWAHRTLVILGAAAMVWTLKNPYTRIVSIVSLYLLVVQFGFFPITRYGYPVITVWLILVPVAVVQIVRMRREKRMLER